jgi:hypothetical protein
MFNTIRQNGVDVLIDLKKNMPNGNGMIIYAKEKQSRDFSPRFLNNQAHAEHSVCNFEDLENLNLNFAGHRSFRRINMLNGASIQPLSYFLYLYSPWA